MKKREPSERIKKNEKPTDEALLVEYQVCQQDSNAMINTHWTVAGIFLAVSTGLLGWLVKSIVSGDIHFNLSSSWIVTVFSLLMACITTLLIYWLKRVNSLVDVNNKRMKQIEKCLGLKKNHMAPNDKRGERIIIRIYLILIALWLGIISIAWIFNC